MRESFTSISTTPSFQRGQLRDFNETPTLELVRIVKRNKAEGRSVLDPESELHKRFSIPVACLVFGLVVFPSASGAALQGKSAGIAVALGVFLVYYMLLGTGKNLAEARTFSPAAAYWVPNGLMLLAAALFVVLKAREIDLGIAHRIARLFGGRPKGPRIPRSRRGRTGKEQCKSQIAKCKLQNDGTALGQGRSF